MSVLFVSHDLASWPSCATGSRCCGTAGSSSRPRAVPAAPTAAARADSEPPYTRRAASPRCRSSADGRQRTRTRSAARGQRPARPVRPGAGRRRGEPRLAARARSGSAWSARAAPARPPSAGRCCRLVPRRGRADPVDGEDIAALRGRRLQQLRRTAQIVFQDPDGTLDPRMRIGTTLARGAARAPDRAARRRGRRRARSCWTRSGSSRSTPAATRTSSRAGSASGWRSPGRWRSSRGCWCSTSRPAPSTSRRRRGSSP